MSLSKEENDELEYLTNELMPAVRRTRNNVIRGQGQVANICPGLREYLDTIDSESEQGKRKKLNILREAHAHLVEMKPLGPIISSLQLGGGGGGGGGDDDDDDNDDVEILYSQRNKNSAEILDLCSDSDDDATVIGDPPLAPISLDSGGGNKEIICESSAVTLNHERRSAADDDEPIAANCQNLGCTNMEPDINQLSENQIPLDMRNGNNASVEVESRDDILDSTEGATGSEARGPSPLEQCFIALAKDMNSPNVLPHPRSITGGASREYESFYYASFYNNLRKERIELEKSISDQRHAIIELERIYEEKKRLEEEARNELISRGSVYMQENTTTSMSQQP